MENYCVTITTRPLGIVFNHITNEDGDRYLEIAQVSMNSPASKLGISIGDRLIAINNKSILNISATVLLKTFHSHSLPFTATFQSLSNAVYVHQQRHQYKHCFRHYLNVPLLHHNNNNNNNDNNNCSLSMNANHGSSSSQEQDHQFLSVCKLELSSSHFVNDSYIVCPEKLEYDDYDLYGNSDDDIDAVHTEMDSIHHDTDSDHNKLEIDETESVDVDDETESVDVDGDETDSECDNDIYLYFNKMEHMNLFNLLQCNGESMVLLSTKGFNTGYHEWSVKILKCDVFKQEIGIISNSDIDLSVVNDDDGIKDTKDFGARAVYGNELCSNKSYYASFNDDNKQRIYKDLSCNNNGPRNIGWCTNDIIKVCMNLDKSRIKFYLNDQKVRKIISLQQNKTYYPIIWFSGNCQYELIHFQ